MGKECRYFQLKYYILFTKINPYFLYQEKRQSGAMLSMLGCNCLVDIKVGTKEVLSGDEVEIILL